MKVSYDRDVDILYIQLTDKGIDGSNEDHSGTIIDYDVDGAVVGIEVLNASRRMAERMAEPGSLELEIA